ncbi:MAG: cyclase family protein [Paracoccaceae bacterium]
MCDICVMNAVKDKMLSRRSFFKTSAMAGVGAVAATTFSPPAALAAGHSNIRDLTHTLHPDFPTYFGVSGFQTEQLFNFADNGFNVFQLAVNEHTGPHIDAPLHYSADGNAVDEIPVENPSNIDSVPAAGATIIVGAPKHRGGSGGPARIIAMV